MRAALTAAPGYGFSGLSRSLRNAASTYPSAGPAAGKRGVFRQPSAPPASAIVKRALTGFQAGTPVLPPASRILMGVGSTEAFVDRCAGSGPAQKRRPQMTSKLTLSLAIALALTPARGSPR